MVSAHVLSGHPMKLHKAFFFVLARETLDSLITVISTAYCSLKPGAFIPKRITLHKHAFNICEDSDLDLSSIQCVFLFLSANHVKLSASP